MKERFTVHPSGEIILLDSFCPWKDHLFTIEQEMGLKEPNQQIKYVLFCDSLNSWRVQCVPVRSGSFENRLSLPAAWRGKRDDELSALSGIPDCIFVHVRCCHRRTTIYKLNENFNRLPDLLVETRLRKVHYKWQLSHWSPNKRSRVFS